ncbi:MAG: preprotein translocase subunit SecG [Desulfuromonadaceae bacterium]
MTTLLLVLHILICLALIGIVLVQGGKGAEMGASFGAGSSQTVFGAAGGQSFMSKLTTGVAVIFMLTSLCLTYFFSQPGASSIMPASVTTAAPETAPISAEPAPTAEAQPAAPEAEKK